MPGSCERERRVKCEKNLPGRGLRIGADIVFNRKGPYEKLWGLETTGDPFWGQ